MTPSALSLRIAYLTAGAAGMYCGSCLHDNTLAAALARLGVDVHLIPTYTPIRTDEHDVSVDRVFFGGINVYLQQKFPLFRHLPRFLDRLLDQPWLLQRVTSQAAEISPDELGALTVSMLRGLDGFQRKEVHRLCDWLAGQVRPDLVILTNILIGGCVPEIKRRLKTLVLVTLQGDDVFLESLPAQYRSRALAEIRRVAAAVDGFLVHSRFYGDFMQEYLGLPPDRIVQVPLGIDVRGFEGPSETASRAAVAPAESTSPKIGYLARLAPEKGLHTLVDAFLELRRLPGMEQVRLEIAGWLGAHQRTYAEEQFAKFRAAGLADAFHYAGVPDRLQKIKFLRALDLFSVPTHYREPKGLYVLEALAAGVPVVQPDHGAFPELLEATGGGRLVPPEDPPALAQAWHDLLTDAEERRRLGQRGQQAVHERYHADAMARGTLEVLGRYGRFKPTELRASGLVPSPKI